MEEVKKQVFNVINDNTALGQVFVVVFFFEDYLMIFQNTSLLRTTIDFKIISLQPFILFFVFIALSKVLWWIWHMLIKWLKSKAGLREEGNGEIYKGVSVLAFMLCILLLVYNGLLYHDQTLMPVSAIVHPFWNRAALSIAYWATVICMIMSIQSVNYDEETK